MFQLQLSNSCEASTFRVDFFKGIGVGKEQTSFFLALFRTVERFSNTLLLVYIYSQLSDSDSSFLENWNLRQDNEYLSTSMLAQS